MVLFLGRPLKDIELMMIKLKEFGLLAGLKINKQKTKILTKNISEQDQLKIINKTGFKVEKKVKYLGVTVTGINCLLFENNYVQTWNKIKKDFIRWGQLNLSLLGRISAIKMNVLPKMLFLFQTIPIIMSDKPFGEWQKDMLKFIWQGKKPRVRFKILQDVKERGGLGLPDLKVYYASCCFLWMKDWLFLQNRKLLTLEGFDLRFGWHGYLWYEKVKANVEFKNHFVRNALWRIWYRYKHRFFSKIPLITSPQEAHFGVKLTKTEKIIDYRNLITSVQGHWEIKTREELLGEGFDCQWFLYIQLIERFKLDKEKYGFEEEESILEKQLKLEKEIISKIYKTLLTIETEEEQVKEYMIVWAKNIGHAILMETWEKVWTKQIKFTLNVNIKENIYKMLFRWYITPSKLSKMYGNVPNKCWKCKKQEGSFFHMWWTCTKAKKYWHLIHGQIQLILRTNIQLKPELFLLGMTDGYVEKGVEPLFWYMISAARILYAQHWKGVEIPTLDEWWTKIRNYAEMDKLTILLREKSTKLFRNNWKPFIDFLQEKDNNYLTTIGFED